MVALTNSKDPDEKPHGAAFNLGLHCLLKQNQSSEKGIQHCFGNCDPSIYTTDHLDFYGKLHWTEKCILRPEFFY